MSDFLQAEIEYFSPILAREKRTSEAMKSAWRQETVRERQRRVSLEVHRMLGGKVMYGPFRGLKLSHSPWWGELDLGSQCLGLYEKELLDYFDSIPSGKFSTFIDIGAADGYYAIGLLKAKIVPTVLCFEMSAKGRDAIKNNWEENGQPDTLHIFDEATPSSLSQISSEALKKSLVLIDIEGAEFELLTDEVLQQFKDSTIIVEIHNWVDSFIDKYSALIARLERLFSIAIIDPVCRDTTSFPELRDFTDDNRALLVSERRPCAMRFLRLTPKRC